MRNLLRNLILTSSLLICALAATPAQAATDPTGFRFASTNFTAHENQGNAVITVTRGDVSQEAYIRYVTTPTASATANSDYRKVKAMLTFLPGQASATFEVPLIDHGASGPPRVVNLGLYGAYPIGLGSPSHATLTILQDDAVSLVRNPFNPLALDVMPPKSDPLRGARPYVDWKYGLSARQALYWRHRHPRLAGMLKIIAAQPEVHRFGGWNGAHPGIAASRYLSRAAMEEPGTVPEMSTYWLNNTQLMHGRCGGYSDSPRRQRQWHGWMESLSRGIGTYRGIMFLEMDSLITSGCLSHHGVGVRLSELHDALNILSSQNPRLVVYLDAGAADALPASYTARMLRMAGVSEIEGFFLNSTHFDWTSHEIAYGEKVSAMTGGKHFVVSTTANGRGPLVPSSRVKYGNEVLCNPHGRGLGPKPTFNTGYRDVDAFAWIGNPGKSGGACGPGEPATGVYWPALAVSLVRHADFKVR